MHEYDLVYSNCSISVKLNSLKFNLNWRREQANGSLLIHEIKELGLGCNDAIFSTIIIIVPDSLVCCEK